MESGKSKTISLLLFIVVIIAIFFLFSMVGKIMKILAGPMLLLLVAAFFLGRYLIKGKK